MKFVPGDIIVDQYGEKFRVVGKRGEMVPIDGHGRFKHVASSFPEESDLKVKPEFEIEVPEDLLNDTFPEDIKEMLLDPAVRRGLVKEARNRNTKAMLKRVQTKIGNPPF